MGTFISFIIIIGITIVVCNAISSTNKKKVNKRPYSSDDNAPYMNSTPTYSENEPIVSGDQYAYQRADPSKHEYFFKISGVSYRGNEAKEKFNSLRAGDTVELVAEPDNQYDRDAIKVIVDGHFIGYVSRECNREISEDMQKGIRFSGDVVRTYLGSSSNFQLIELIATPLNIQDVFKPYTEFKDKNIVVSGNYFKSFSKSDIDLIIELSGGNRQKTITAKTHIAIFGSDPTESQLRKLSEQQSNGNPIKLLTTKDLKNIIAYNAANESN